MEAIYAHLPLARRGGWGYLMLTTGLPSLSGPKGNGTYTLEAIAFDFEGNQTALGRKTISVNNAASVKPFGSIDTPGPGATVSGPAYVNFGWALTPQPNTVPRDGHTIRVDIDGVPQGTVKYDNYRADIAGGFPGYANSNGAVGHLMIDTTKLSNGTHTIGWLVYDDKGNGDGIGSRFFNVLNAAGASEAPLPAPAQEAPAVFDGDRVMVSSLGRVEFQLPGDGEWEGALVVDGEHRALPAGSRLDGEHGRFYWRLAPGFSGEYVLEFLERRTGAVHRVSVGLDDHVDPAAGRMLVMPRSR